MGERRCSWTSMKSVHMCCCYRLVVIREKKYYARLAQLDRASDSYIRRVTAISVSEGCEFDPRGGLVNFFSSSFSLAAPYS